MVVAVPIPPPVHIVTSWPGVADIASPSIRTIVMRLSIQENILLLESEAILGAPVVCRGSDVVGAATDTGAISCDSSRSSGECIVSAL
ncbi:MAG: hypothetical protein WAO15_02910 [Mycobacterium sp.]